MSPLATKIRQQLDEHRDRNIALWRQWARELAQDGTSPRPLDVLQVAAALEIQDPGATLERDAEGFREYLTFKASAEFCAADREAKLREHGGRPKLLAALERAEAEVARLREIVADLDNNPSEGFWKSAMSRSEREHPRLFGAWPRRPRPEDMEVFDVC